MREAASQNLVALGSDFGGARGAATSQRALVACAAQIVVENVARKGQGSGD